MKKLKIFKLLIIAFLLVAQSALADGLIIIPRPEPLPTPYPLEVVYHHVDVKINGNIAETLIDQEFYNPSNHLLEGYYIFPIPKGAVINEFSMEINGEMVYAELLDAIKARQIYEDIVRQIKDPALLEYTGQGIFKVRIFPIEPKSKKKVTISYREVLSSDNGLYEYVYPLNTEKFSAKPLKNVRVKVDLKTNKEIKNIYSPTHPVDVVNKDNHNAVISFEEENTKPDIDFKLYYSTNNDDVGLSLLTYKTGGEDGYFLLTAAPSFIIDENQIDTKDITFVLDVSGSMAGEKLRQAKKALLYCVNNLNKGDGFDIVKFSTEGYSLFGQIESATEPNIKKAEKFINGLKPIGGTNIEDALNLALDEKRNSNRTHLIIFITDGNPTIGVIEDENLLKKIENMNDDKTRIFTFGIGNEINTHLLDKITEQTRAFRTYISENEDIEIKISSFYDKVQSPVLTNISFSFSNGIRTFQTYPSNLPDLFRGSSLTIFGRYSSNGSSRITLDGTVNGEKRVFNIDTDFTNEKDEYDFIPPLWASRRIGFLLDQIRLNRDEKELVDEITQLAREHGIVTPYTSYLIMEDEEIRVSRNELVDHFQTLPPAPELRRENEGDFDAMKEKSGDRSVTASEELQGLNQASNYGETKQGSGRMKYVDEAGIERNLTQQVRNIQGRAVYQSGKFWVDSDLQNEKVKNQKRIQFNSDEYFKLLNEEPETAQFLALGQNVRFYYDNTYYEIYE
ncbi:MAG: VIT and VWA domain-containing protein [Ignavibacteria bacterium]|nr:VIT and VWA domain-containing protein [Ignavibacteria bacterium]MBT8383714.1 VIT and VWA domain-containing protein [Ignavibacteria bacterium]MBT8390703.1 VIT and VWA domain-containing protein [Ignavibacteria bacterium]NNJ53327.1 VWA domain-containing protein [Ignavibacteriaceae bacterium]NNL22265.1 VWA domain-containing protein [Ignavibacteriaceae bacterium]